MKLSRCWWSSTFSLEALLWHWVLELVWVFVRWAILAFLNAPLDAVEDLSLSSGCSLFLFLLCFFLEDILLLLATGYTRSPLVIILDNATIDELLDVASYDLCLLHLLLHHFHLLLHVIKASHLRFDLFLLGWCKLLLLEDLLLGPSSLGASLHEVTRDTLGHCR